MYGTGDFMQVMDKKWKGINLECPLKHPLHSSYFLTSDETPLAFYYAWNAYIPLDLDTDILKHLEKIV